jgi:IS30 family transposase
MEKESLERMLRQELTISEIAKRFGKAPSTVACWMEKHGLQAVYRDTHSRELEIDRERLETLVGGGMTIAEIAAELHLTPVTVRRRLARFGLRTSRTQGLRRRRPQRQRPCDRDACMCPAR